MTSRKRARLRDVAEKAGVSLGLASAALRGDTTSSIRVSSSTAERVRGAAQELGYVANSVARSLSEGRKRIFGVFTYEPLFSPETVEHYSPFLFGIEQECEMLGYDLLLITNPVSNAGPRTVIDGAIHRLDFTDGGILFGHEPDTRDIEQLGAMGFPYVFIGRRELEGGEAPSVAADYAGATYALVQELIKNGHRAFVYAGLHSSREYARDREDGFSRALREQADACRVDTWRGELEEIGRAQVDGWLSRGATAYVFETPGEAQRWLRLAQEADKVLPERLSFVVLTDVHYSERSHSNWATLVVPRVEMGRAAVRMLERRLVEDSAPAEPMFIPCAIRFGTSIRPVEEAEAAIASLGC